MPLMEYQGAWYRIEYGLGCRTCLDASGFAGVVYEHDDTCASNGLCSGSGVHPETDCLGTYLPCPSCGTMEPVQ